MPQENVKQLTSRVEQLESKLQEVLGFLSNVGQGFENLELRLAALEGDKTTEPPTREEVHAEMERTGDSYEECQMELMNKRRKNIG